ncbi:MAG TPA: hypothetical protein VHN80_16410, partial [Kineosporiaceae bacterium]|nr:hypothetical protein [Kineosporiaceae bacterium]
RPARVRSPSSSIKGGRKPYTSLRISLVVGRPIATRGIDQVPGPLQAVVRPRALTRRPGDPDG